MSDGNTPPGSIGNSAPRVTMRRRAEPPPDPSRQLFDDGAWYREGSHTMPPADRIDGTGLSWPCALAWICARDPALVRAFAERCAGRPGLGISDAAALLTEILAREHGGNTAGAARAVEQARDQLLGLLWRGAIVGWSAETKSDRSAARIPSRDWHAFADVGAHEHDVLFDDDQQRILHHRVRLDEQQLLSRWPERLATRLQMLAGPTWSLGETLYWINHQTHVGYRGAETPRPLRPKQKFRVELRDALADGRIACRASIMTDAPAVESIDITMVERGKEFWKGFGLADIQKAEFKMADVIGRWKPQEKRKFAGREDAVAQYRKEGHTAREAREKVKEEEVPPATRGRPRKAPNI